MENFRIYDDEHPAPIETKSYTRFDEGNYTLHGAVWCFEDAGEAVTVHVAVPRRTAILEASEEITYTNLHLLPA